MAVKIQTRARFGRDRVAGSGDGICVALMYDWVFTWGFNCLCPQESGRPPELCAVTPFLFSHSLSAKSAQCDFCDPSPLLSASFGPRVTYNSANDGDSNENHKGFVPEFS